MIRDSGSNFTAAFDAVLADAGIQTVLCNIRTPRMSACRTLDRGMPTRTPGPHPNLESGPICGRILRDYEIHYNQHRPRRSLHGAAAEPATRAGRSQPAPRLQTDSRRRPDQRIPPGRMTWTTFSARTGGVRRRRGHHSGFWSWRRSSGAGTKIPIKPVSWHSAPLADHHRPWSSPSSTSAYAGYLALSCWRVGQRPARTSRSWCFATRCACSSASSTRACVTDQQIERSARH